jgi:hypothetical protein
LPVYWALQDLQNRRLKIARIHELNDPFELLAFDLGNAAQRQSFRKTRDEISRDMGILCFSREWNNPVLWSHYADKHRGICLGFETDDEIPMPVDYTADRPVLPDSLPEEMREGFALQMLSTKFKDWSYENEVRIYIRLNPTEEKDGLYYTDFGGSLNLKQVILGPLCSDSDSSSIATIVQGDFTGIELIKARLAFRSFQVVEDKRGPGLEQS